MARARELSRRASQPHRRTRVSAVKLRSVMKYGSCSTSTQRALRALADRCASREGEPQRTNAVRPASARSSRVAVTRPSGSLFTVRAKCAFHSVAVAPSSVTSHCVTKNEAMNSPAKPTPSRSAPLHQRGWPRYGRCWCAGRRRSIVAARRMWLEPSAISNAPPRAQPTPVPRGWPHCMRARLSPFGSAMGSSIQRLFGHGTPLVLLLQVLVLSATLSHHHVSPSRSAVLSDSCRGDALHEADGIGRLIDKWPTILHSRHVKSSHMSRQVKFKLSP